MNDERAACHLEEPRLATMGTKVDAKLPPRPASPLELRRLRVWQLTN